MGCQISCIEYVFPEKVITNADLKKEFPDYDFSKFEERVGIEERYVVDKDETSLDLAVKACELVFKRFDKLSIDYILLCTQSPDYILPTSACILQNRLGLNKNVGSFDFNLGCSGYTYGLSMAKALIVSKQAKNVLVVTAETYSKFLHVKDKSNRAIFGDAATATIISESENDFINEFLFGTDGSGFDKLIIKNGASRNPFSYNPTEKSYGSENVYNDNHLYMDGPEIFKFTTEVIPKFTEEILNKNNVEKETIDQFILHQANAFMLSMLRKKMKIEEKKFFIDLKKGGNTVSCTIPIALKKYSQLKTNNKAEAILLVGFGVGLSWSGGIIKISQKL